MKNFEAKMNDIPMYIVPETCAQPFLLKAAQMVCNAGLTVMFGREEK